MIRKATVGVVFAVTLGMLNASAVQAADVLKVNVRISNPNKNGHGFKRVNANVTVSFSGVTVSTPAMPSAGNFVRTIQPGKTVNGAIIISWPAIKKGDTYAVRVSGLVGASGMDDVTCKNTAPATAGADPSAIDTLSFAIYTENIGSLFFPHWALRCINL